MYYLVLKRYESTPMFFPDGGNTAFSVTAIEGVTVFGYSARVPAVRNVLQAPGPATGEPSPKKGPVKVALQRLRMRHQSHHSQSRAP